MALLPRRISDRLVIPDAAADALTTHCFARTVSLAVPRDTEGIDDP